MYLPNKLKHEIYTTINFTRYSVTEVSALSAAGWVWSLHASRPEWQAGCNGSVASTGGVLV